MGKYLHASSPYRHVCLCLYPICDIQSCAPEYAQNTFQDISNLIYIYIYIHVIYSISFQTFVQVYKLGSDS